MDKLAIYRGLGVPEVWLWQEGGLSFYLLDEGGYTVGPRSTRLPAEVLSALWDEIGEAFTAEQAESGATGRATIPLSPGLPVSGFSTSAGPCQSACCLSSCS